MRLFVPTLLFFCIRFWYVKARIPQARRALVPTGPSLHECAVFHPCTECEGHCESDDECEFGLECFYRNGIESVPGCFGEGKSGLNYCFNPLSDQGGVPLESIGVDACTEEEPCGLCQGHCDDNAECAGFLECEQRDDGDPGPAQCSGTPYSDYDYCVGMAEGLQWMDWDGCKYSPCEVCEGDCDNDSECKGHLRCFDNAGTSDPIPSCSGTVDNGYDYCF